MVCLRLKGSLVYNMLRHLNNCIEVALLTGYREPTGGWMPHAQYIPADIGQEIAAKDHKQRSSVFIGFVCELFCTFRGTIHFYSILSWNVFKFTLKIHFIFFVIEVVLPAMSDVVIDVRSMCCSWCGNLMNWCIRWCSLLSFTFYCSDVYAFLVVVNE